jgi:ribosomal protein L11 methylase PrmA
MADQRRQELIPFVFHHTQGQVQTGPFAGMIIVPRSMWGDGDVASKLLGVYENELHKFVQHAAAVNHDAVINIGSAEGYYSVGFARLMPQVSVTAVDIDPRSAEVVKMNAEINQVTNLDTVTAHVDVAWLEQRCASCVCPLLVIDCEGAELSLLDPNTVPSLSRASILVESHDCVTAGITDTLIQRFSHSHVIQSVSQQFKDPYQFEFLKELSDCDKWALVHEGRPSTMTWLYMTPRA